ncbi:hypothetical protein LXL04_034566 [Taraxacum kok-saghyz]
MAISPYLLPAVLLYYVLMAVIPQSSGTGGDGHRHLIDRIREAELKVVQLGKLFSDIAKSILMESNSIVDSKNLYVKESEKLVEEMTSEVNHLQSVLLTMKNDSSCENERLTRLEEEVRLLWDTSRRNNFELHILESKAEDAEKRLQVTKSKVETMAAIVTQHWIHIQHLEQALEIAKRGVEEVERQVTRCTFLKVQEFVENELQKWNYTANKEVVFFLASALITFPALSLGVFFLNNFCY